MYDLFVDTGAKGLCLKENNFKMRKYFSKICRKTAEIKRKGQAYLFLLLLLLFLFFLFRFAFCFVLFFYIFVGEIGCGCIKGFLKGNRYLF